METIYDMWKEELSLVDKTLAKVIEALEAGDVDSAYKAVYDLLVWWSKKRNKYDIKEYSGKIERIEFLKNVAMDKHPISEEYILPKVSIREFVSKMLELINSWKR